MTLGDEAFGSIRIGVSTLLMRKELIRIAATALLTAALALAVAVFVAGAAGAAAAAGRFT